MTSHAAIEKRGRVQLPVARAAGPGSNEFSRSAGAPDMVDWSGPKLVCATAQRSLGLFYKMTWMCAIFEGLC